MTKLKSIKSILFIIIALTLCLQSCANELALNKTETQVYFSPQGGCTEAIVSAIAQAKTEILIQAYSFTSTPIAKALINAHKRGVKVETILDKSNVMANYSSAAYLSNNGIPVFIDAAHAIAHNKIIIIDKEIVITGSFNFTKAAENNNAENLLIIKSKKLAKSYLENWTKHQAHSEKYQ